MPLLINEHSVNSAQFFEIYHSEKNARVLGEAMALPTYVVEEVRRQIKDEGLKYVKSDVVVQKNIPFGKQPINKKRLITMNTIVANNKLPALPAAVSTTASADKTAAINSVAKNEPSLKLSALELAILKIFATATTLIMPLNVHALVGGDKDKCKFFIAQLKNIGLISRALNGKYTISQLGVDTLKTQYGFGQISQKALLRIEHYNAFPNQLYNPTVLALKSRKNLNKSEDVSVVDQEKQALSEMCKDHITEDGPSSVDQELAAFDGLFDAELNDVPTKIKIINKVRSHFTGDVAKHLIELEQYLQKKAG